MFFKCSLPKGDPSEVAHPWHEHSKSICWELTLSLAGGEGTGTHPADGTVGPKSVPRGDPAPFSFQLLQTETTMRISLTRFGNAKWQKKKSSQLITERVG